MARATAQVFDPRPLGPWGGAKRSNIQFQIFLNQTLCVFLQMKNIKHIRRDFHSVSWVIPQGWNLGWYRGVGVKIIFSKIQSNLVCESHEWHVQRHNIFGPHPLGGVKRSNTIRFLRERVDFRWRAIECVLVAFDMSIQDNCWNQLRSKIILIQQR